MRLVQVGFAVGCVVMLGGLGCGTYSELAPEAHSVSATTTRPSGNCQSLSTLTGKGGGATGAYVSNEDLIRYAVNDLRNQAASLGATHVVYSSPSLGGNEGTTTSAMVMGEAFRCEGDQQPAAPAAPVVAAATTAAPTPAPAPSGGCDYDTQCKGDRVCVNHSCTDPAPKAERVEGAPAPPATSTPQAFGK